MVGLRPTHRFCDSFTCLVFHCEMFNVKCLFVNCDLFDHLEYANCFLVIF